jgi:hypothetical protein
MNSEDIRLKSCKRPNMRIMDTKEGEEVPAKSINDILNKIIAEKSPNLEKEMPIQVQEASRTPTDMTKIEPLSLMIMAYYH